MRFQTSNIHSYYATIILISACLISACSHNKLPQNGAYIPDEIPLAELATRIPDLQDYLALVEFSLKQEIPVVRLDTDELSAEAFSAESLALSNTEFRRNCWHFESGAPLHSEIMSIEKLEKGRYKVSMYNFFYNSTALAIVDVHNNVVQSVENVSAYQPEVNNRLKHLAALVAKEYLLLEGDITVEFKASKAERSRHLCIAPVMLFDTEVIWPLVDLNNWQLIGVKNLDPSEYTAELKITERMLQNEFVMENFCDKQVHLTQGDWELDYVLTESDGLEIKNVYFKGAAIVRSAKLLDWHVNYPFGDGYGFTDAMGCPMFSSAAVVAFDKPEVALISDDFGGEGFSLIQDFRSPVWPLSCNYRYQNLFAFYTDGTIRISGVNLGLGCGEGGTYKPVFRVDLFPNTSEAETVHYPNGEAGKELWRWHDKKDSLPLYALGNSNMVYAEHQWNKGATHIDFAYSYISKYHTDKDEGVTSLATIGGHKNKDNRQGPEQFIADKESLENSDVVLWYVPQMSNSNIAGEKYCWVDSDVKLGKEFNTVWPGSAGLIIRPNQICNFCE